MLTKKVKTRINFLIISALFTGVVIFIVLKSLEENVVYFFSPTEIYDKANIPLKKKIRIGGLVKTNSIKKNNTIVNFTITDLKNEIVVSYNGMLPNLFAEGKSLTFVSATKIVLPFETIIVIPKISSPGLESTTFFNFSIEAA